LWFVLCFLKAKFGYRITWSFFASNHGKSACDSRAANAKARLRRAGLAADEPIVGAEGIASVIGEMRHCGEALAYNYFVRAEGRSVELLTAGKLKASHFFEHVGAVDKSATLFTLRAAPLAGKPLDPDDASDLQLRTSFVMDVEEDGKEMDTKEKVDKKGELVNKGERKRRREERLELISAKGAKVDVAFEREGFKK
jgi:hypothetical protein